MNIRNPNNYVNSFWDWTFLNDVFYPSKIRVTDIDGFVERNGKFLLIETKKPNEAVPVGQQILHKAAIDNGSFTIIIIWGFPQRPTKIKIMTRKYVDEKPVTSIDEVKSIVKQWFDYANGQAARRQ